MRLCSDVQNPVWGASDRLLRLHEHSEAHVNLKRSLVSWVPVELCMTKPSIQNYVKKQSKMTTKRCKMTKPLWGEANWLQEMQHDHKETQNNYKQIKENPKETKKKPQQQITQITRKRCKTTKRSKYSANKRCKMATKLLETTSKAKWLWIETWNDNKGHTGHTTPKMCKTTKRNKWSWSRKTTSKRHKICGRFVSSTVGHFSGWRFWSFEGG